MQSPPSTGLRLSYKVTFPFKHPNSNNLVALNLGWILEWTWGALKNLRAWCTPNRGPTPGLTCWEAAWALGFEEATC